MDPANIITDLRNSTSSPVHICLTTCDKHVYWLTGRYFTRKLVPDHLNTAYSSSDVPFNDEFGGNNHTHLCYILHRRETTTSPSTCIYDVGSPIIVHTPTPGSTGRQRRGNVFNSLYWRRCDGTFRNVLDEVLISEQDQHQHQRPDRETLERESTLAATATATTSTSSGSSGSLTRRPNAQLRPVVRLRDVIEPKTSCTSTTDLAKFERWKDAYVQRFM